MAIQVLHATCVSGNVAICFEKALLGSSDQFTLVVHCPLQDLCKCCMQISEHLKYSPGFAKTRDIVPKRVLLPVIPVVNIASKLLLQQIYLHIDYERADSATWCKLCLDVNAACVFACSLLTNTGVSSGLDSRRCLATGWGKWTMLHVSMTATAAPQTPAAHQAARTLTQMTRRHMRPQSTTLICLYGTQSGSGTSLQAGVGATLKILKIHHRMRGQTSGGRKSILGVNKFYRTLFQ